MRPEGELGAGGEDGGEGMGDGVKGLLLEKLKEPKERGESAPALLTMGMGEVTFLLLPGLQRNRNTVTLYFGFHY